MRVHSNIAEWPGRRLAKQYNGSSVFQGAGSSGSNKATSSNAPTVRAQSMGLTGKNGIVSFFASDFGTGITCTLWVWHKDAAQVNSGNGWVKLGAVAAENQKTVDQLSIASFTCEEGVPFYVQTGTQSTEFFVSGIQDDNNPNTDVSLNTQR